MRLPSGRSITVETLGTDSIHDIKLKIEAADPIYPSPHQRLVEPGRSNDLLDDDEIRHYLYYSNCQFVLRGNVCVQQLAQISTDLGPTKHHNIMLGLSSSRSYRNMSHLFHHTISYKVMYALVGAGNVILNFTSAMMH